MKIITFSEIKKLAISPKTCVQWVNEALQIKYDAMLPKKISLSPISLEHVFYNTMPCIVQQMNRGG